MDVGTSSGAGSEHLGRFSTENVERAQADGNGRSQLREKGLEEIYIPGMRDTSSFARVHLGSRPLLIAADKVEWTMTEHTLGPRAKPARAIPRKRDNIATSQLADKLLAPEGINFPGLPCV